MLDEQTDPKPKITHERTRAPFLGAIFDVGRMANVRGQDPIAEARDEEVCCATPSMNRPATVVVGAAIVALIGFLVWKSGGGPSRSAASPAASGAREGPMGPAPDAAVIADPLALLKLDGDGGLAILGDGPEAKNDDTAPGLPSGSPKTVRFGVILVQYRGAELAPPNARSKQEATALARTIAAAATADFKAQVRNGDPGSMEDAGRIPRGVLEPAVEYALFMLPRGDVSEPIDTPRGFWIVRRIE